MFATLRERLVKIIQSPIESMNYDLIGIELIRSRKMIVRVYIDKKRGKVTIDDCVIVSNLLSSALDIEGVISIPYNLEVSSPGLNRPLFFKTHFIQFIGMEINLVSYVMVGGRRKWRGVIKEVNSNDGTIVLTVDKVKDISFSFNNIQKANLIPRF